MSASDRDEQRGAALIITMMLLAVLLVLGAVYLKVSTTESEISESQVESSLAFNSAEAGLEHALALLPTTDVDALLLGGGNLLVNQTLGDGRYDVAITNNVSPEYPRGVIPADGGGATVDNDGYVVLTSTGQFAQAHRVVAVLVQKTGGGPPSPFTWGIYGDLKVQTSGGEIDGATPGSDCGLRTNGEVDPGSTMVYGDVTAGGIVKNQPQISGTIVEFAPPVSFPTVSCPVGGYTPAASVPSGPGITYNDATGILKLSGSANLTLAAGTYYFKEVSASTLVNFNVSGPSEVYIDLKLDFKGASRLNPTGSPSDLMIWGCGLANISLAIKDGGVNNFGIYAPTGYYDMSSGSEAYGAVLAKEFKMSGNSNFYCDGSMTGGGGGGGGAYQILPGTWTELY